MVQIPWTNPNWSLLEDVNEPAHYFKNWQIKSKNQVFILFLLYEFYHCWSREVSLSRGFPTEEEGKTEAE